MKVYGIQLDSVWEKKEQNFLQIKHLLEKETIDKNSLILFPETFATGFSLNTEITTEGEPDKTSSFLKDLSLHYHSWVAGGIIQNIKQQNFNRFICYSPKGEKIIAYDKIHLISTLGEDNAHTAGRECKTFEIGPFTICPAICYDLRFPELFRAGTRIGANLFVVIACWPNVRIQHWTSLLQARAIENQAFVVGLNRTGKEPENKYNGNSIIFGPKGEIINQLKCKPGILSGEVKIDEVLDWRREFPAQEHKCEELFLPMGK